MAPNPMTGILVRDRRGDTNTEKSCDNGGRDRRDKATSAGMPGASEAGRGEGPSREPLEGAWPFPAQISAALPHLVLSVGQQMAAVWGGGL